MSPDAKLLLWAVVVQAALAFVLLIWLVFLRGRDINSGSVRPDDVALGQRKWSARATQVGNNFTNQFEAPVLFYVVAILFVIVLKPGLLVVAMAWVFVVTRIVHTLIHTTFNRVAIRGLVYGIGIVALIVLWVDFALKLLAVPAF